jgi:ATP-binding cassette subfamily B (MDR/TAP) protein 1
VSHLQAPHTADAATASAPDSLSVGIVGDVAFENVNFAYPSREHIDVLSNFSLHVPAQTTTAIVGSSGGGKSSALAILSRFYQPYGGRVTIDGRDISSYNVRDLRRHMTLVQQEPVLFGLSIRDNVCYGCHEYMSDAAVQEACKQANAHEFIAGENPPHPAQSLDALEAEC